jgi:hypothetical protein
MRLVALALIGLYALSPVLGLRLKKTRDTTEKRTK